MKTKNILQSIPENIPEEIFEDILKTENVRIERIISKGHISPKSGWYNQNENEWVIVLEGSAIIEFENGEEIKLTKGDHLNIPKHTKHKVTYTDPDTPTIWLAVFCK